MVISSSPSMWPFVVRALGFDLASMTTKDAVFRTVVGDAYPRAIANEDTSDVQAVFGSAADFAALPRVHWQQHRVPHVYTIDSGKLLPSMRGWRGAQSVFSHSNLGGLTTGAFSMGVLVPQDRWRDVQQQTQFPRQASSSLWTVMDSTVSAAPVRDASVLDSLQQRPPNCDHPQFIGPGRGLDPRGIAPGRGLETMRVLAPCVRNRVKWGVRQLTPAELGSVFDIPLLMQDRMLRMGHAGERLIRSLCGQHPGKVLHLGSDHLLSLYSLFLYLKCLY